MSWFGKLMGTDRAVDNVLDRENGLLVRAGEWIGNQNYTEEEKAEANAETRQWALRQLEALGPFRIVQRILALSACTVWVLLALNVVIAIWLNNEPVKASLLDFAFSQFIFWPVMAVFSLYCAGGVLPDVYKGTKKR